jgi:hypothetical protein
MMLVDRPILPHLFLRCGVRPSTLAVTCIDGTPAPVVEWLQRGFRKDHRVAVLYLHDAATVVYPFTLEPIATLIANSTHPLAYLDVGLPPLGASARRFAEPALGGALVREVDEIPPSALIRHCLRIAESLAETVAK